MLQEDMTKKPAALGEVLNLRLSAEMVERLAALAAALEERTGVDPGRSNVARVAMLRGLASLEAENGIKPPKVAAKVAPKTARKRARKVAP